MAMCIIPYVSGKFKREMERTFLPRIRADECVLKDVRQFNASHLLWSLVPFSATRFMEAGASGSEGFE
jgi:hypothetical protein